MWFWIAAPLYEVPLNQVFDPRLDVTDMEMDMYMTINTLLERHLIYNDKKINDKYVYHRVIETTRPNIYIRFIYILKADDILIALSNKQNNHEKKARKIMEKSCSDLPNLNWKFNHRLNLCHQLSMRDVLPDLHYSNDISVYISYAFSKNFCVCFLGVFVLLTSYSNSNIK